MLNMGVVFSRFRQIFEWDAQKAASNQAKHGISFEQASEVFLDPFVCFVDASTPEESRLAAIGMTVAWAILFVVHRVERAEVIRIISARPATPSERRGYQNE